jgi:hypothetical protein
MKKHSARWEDVGESISLDELLANQNKDQEQHGQSLEMHQ